MSSEPQIPPMEQQQQHQEQEEGSTQSKKAAKLEKQRRQRADSGRAHAICSVSKKMAFLVVRERGFTVQCVLSVAPDVVSLQMVNFATGLSKDSYVDVEGIISVPKDPIIGASQQ
ncbi:Aspartate--tRNA ligase 2, cytoplasmic [Camellia lanceoleosa]|uniref:Aspartate--tRNA ligase 2, cytoplasmic n=1 Tax=Camellia lanceoleosa TaxID=1840588 RepID=A0ACC0I6H8_9ERIC|nr:Aspartate--tRNA ligase 2, cytoplasmic [Camellia lanceoleosa]